MKISLDKFDEIDLYDFVDVLDGEKIRILEMRNHNEVRKWMYNKDTISFESHVEFIKSLKNNLKSRYFIVKQLERWVGVLYFININSSSAEFGFYANPFDTVAGVGRMLEEIAIYYAFEVLNLKKLKLEVITENKQVVNLHKKYNFETVGEKNVLGQDVVCMELKLISQNCISKTYLQGGK